jgi:hypothetical protein
MNLLRRAIMATVVTTKDGVSVLNADQEVCYYNMDYVTHVHKLPWNNWVLEGFCNGEHTKIQIAGLPESLWWVKTLIKEDNENAYKTRNMLTMKL